MRLIFYPQLFFAASAVAGNIAAVRTMDGSAILQKPDLDIKSKSSSSSSVIVKRGFLTKFQTRSYRRNDDRYERRSVPGCKNDYVREFGGAFIPRTFMRRLVEVGGEQCPSDEYEANLPSGMHVVTTHINGTTDPHVDVNPDKELITNDVAVVFLNTNEGAKFVIGEEMFDVEEGTLLMFPGGLVHHYIKMMKGNGGFVHFLGPFEVGGSHGVVGASEIVGTMWTCDSTTTAVVSYDYGFGGRKRQLELDGDVTTNSSNAIIGDIYVTGYTNGTHPDGSENHTLHFQWDLEGLYTDGKVVAKDDPNYCDSVEIGQIESNSAGGIEITQIKMLLAEAAQGESFVNVGKSIESLIGYPLVVQGGDGAVLGCDILTKISTDATTPPVDGSITEDTSNASSISTGLVVAFVGAVAASFMTI